MYLVGGKGGPLADFAVRNEVPSRILLFGTIIFFLHPCISQKSCSAAARQLLPGASGGTGKVCVSLHAMLLCGVSLARMA